jgi:hypothetical protein
MKYTRAMTLSKGWKDLSAEINNTEPLLSKDPEQLHEEK